MYAVLATRTGGSIFGAAAAYTKDRDGNVQYFETQKDAEMQAQILQRPPHHRQRRGHFACCPGGLIDGHRNRHAGIPRPTDRSHP